MAYCPQCLHSYNEPLTYCEKCGEKLENLDSFEVNSFDHMKITYLTTASSDMEASMLQELLLSNNIPSIKKYREAGGYLSIYMGDTSFGVDIYVDREQLPLAKSVIPKINDDESEMLEEEIDSNEHIGKKSAWMKILFVIICILTIVFYGLANYLY